MTRQELEHEIMQLPTEEQELLFLHLARALDEATVVEVTGQDREVWDKRFEQWRSGEVQGIPGDQVTDNIRRELGWT